MCLHLDLGLLFKSKHFLTTWFQLICKWLVYLGKGLIGFDRAYPLHFTLLQLLSLLLFLLLSISYYSLGLILWYFKMSAFNSCVLLLPCSAGMMNISGGIQIALEVLRNSAYKPGKSGFQTSCYTTRESSYTCSLYIKACNHFIVLSFRNCTKPLPRIWRGCVQSNSVATCKHGNFEGMHQIRWPHAPVDMGWHYAFQQYKLWLQILLWVLFITFWFHTELSTCLLAGYRESMITASECHPLGSPGENVAKLGMLSRHYLTKAFTW